MNLGLNEEQVLLRESVDRYVEREYSMALRRKLAAGDDGFSREHWARFAELGWLAAPFAEADGGLGGSLVEVALIMEAFGRGLVLEPYVSTVVLGGSLVSRNSSGIHKDALLPALIEGRLLLALAHVEPQARYNLADVETTARWEGTGYVLRGHKSVVFHAPSADQLIVSARTAGASRDRHGISLYLVDRNARGLVLRPYPTVDGLRAAEVNLDGVRVDAAAVLGEPDRGLALIEEAVERAIVAQAAEAVGAMDTLVRTTRDYLKTREQFGVPLATFQVLQHRVVDMFMAHQLSRSLVYRAASGFADAETRERASAASAVKVQTGQAGKLVGQEAIQLHGGMGMSDEVDVGHYFKRLSMIEMTFGNTDHHLRRMAELDADAV